MTENPSIEYRVLGTRVDKYKLCSDILILNFKVCFVKAVSVCMREIEKGKSEAKGFNFI